jgi:hypothetical protein
MKWIRNILYGCGYSNKFCWLREKREEGFAGILNVENEMLQAAIRRNKALITRNKNKAL